MSVESLRAELADFRRAIDRLERERNRAGVVLAALESWQDRADRGLDATSGDGAGAGGDGADGTSAGAGADLDPVAAFERLGRPHDDESADDRRAALAYLGEPALEGPDGDRVSAFERMRTYAGERTVSTQLWGVVTALESFVGGETEWDGVEAAFRRFVDGDALDHDLVHLVRFFEFVRDAATARRERAIAQLNGSLEGADDAEPGALQRYLDATDEDPIAILQEQPVALLPVRLETRFVNPDTGESYDPGYEGDHELRVRVYPDQVHVDEHEEELTAEEVTGGQTFWAYVWYACHPRPSSEDDLPRPDGSSGPGGSGSSEGDRRESVYLPRKVPEAVRARGVLSDLDDRREDFAEDGATRYEELKERAWRQLEERFGTERAAYLVHALRPTEAADRMLAGWEDGPPWASATDAPALSFPTVPRRPDTWTRQPTARLLPDRWVLTATWRADGGETTKRVETLGTAIREPLPVGPDPETVTTDDAGNATVPAGMEWMVDYEAALRAGMALTVTAADLDGHDPAAGEFETLAVFGVKTSLSDAESATALRDLLDAHHYTDGLEFLEPGTPTNNADVPSGYSSGSSPVERMAVEAGPPLVETGDYTDGDVLARALGIAPDEGKPHVFGHVGNAGLTVDRDQRHMNAALWPATIEYVLQHLLVPNRWGPAESIWADVDGETAEGPPADRAEAMRRGLAWIAAYRRHFVRYVRPNGPFPTLRVDQQPYGVLPATPLSTQCGLDEIEGAWLSDPSLLANVDPAIFGGEGGESSPILDLGSTTLAATVLGGSAEDGDVDSRTQGEAGAVRSDGGDTDPPDAEDADRPGGEDAYRPDGGDEEFTLRPLPWVGGEQYCHLARWIDRFSDVWAAALAGENDAGDPAVPRFAATTLEEDTLVEILRMEAAAGDYARSAVYTTPAVLADLLASADDDASPASLRTDLEGLEAEQIAEIREVLRARNMTALDPRIAHLVYENVLPDWLGWRTMTPLVDDDIWANLHLLRWDPLETIRTMGNEFDARSYGFDVHDVSTFDDSVVHEAYPGEFNDIYEPAKRRAVLAKMDLIRRFRDDSSPYAGTEPVVQKSLLRLLLRFAVVEEFVTGRIQLGARYDDPVETGPDPVGGSDPRWFATLHDPVPDALAAHPELGTDPTYLDALEQSRNPLAGDPVLPRFDEFAFSLRYLGAQPPETLARAASGTLDAASHRLDAWWTSLGTCRLFELRDRQGGWRDRHYADDVPMTVPLTAAVASNLADATAVLGAGTSGDEAESSDDEAETAGDGDSSGRRVEDTDAATSADLSAALAGQVATTENWAAAREADLSWRAAELAGSTSGDDGQDPEPSPAVAATAGLADDRRPSVATDVVGGEWEPSVVTDALDPEDLPDAVGLVDPNGAPAVYVGGYAVGEHLAPDDADDEAEYLQAPSIQHASTAAFLRSGYEAHRDDELADMLAIDLSADRVRLARELLEGVRQGQSLGALLGYRFERGLHKRDLQQYVHDFREVAPAVSGSLDHDPDEPGEVGTAEARSDVVDGYVLYRKWTNDEIPFEADGSDDDSSEVDLSDLSPDDVAPVFSEVGRCVDALEDLLTAEAVHQLGKGNFERAGASIDELAAGSVPPEPEVVQTPRSGNGLTHRHLVCFPAPGDPFEPDPSDAWMEEASLPWLPLEGDASPPPAEGSPLRARADGEPVLDAWVGEVLPDPATVGCTAVFTWEVAAGAGDDSTETGDDTTGPGDDASEAESIDETATASETTTATLADLSLSPLDALFATQPTADADDSELERRFAYALRCGRPDGIPRDADLELRFRDAGDDAELSVAAFLELARSLRALVLDGRAADGDDVSPATDPGGSAWTDHTERVLAARADRAERSLERIGYELKNRRELLDSPPEESTLLARVAAAVGAVETFAGALPGDAGRSGVAASPDAPTERVRSYRESLLDAAGAVDPGSLSAELSDLRTMLPAGPSDPAESDASIFVEPAADQPVGGTIDSGGGASPPAEVEVQCWSHSLAASIDQSAMTTTDDAGRFEVGLDFEGVPRGTHFTVVGSVDGSVVYGAVGRVGGADLAPSTVEAALADDLPTLAALLRLDRASNRLAPREDTPAGALQDALVRVPWGTVGDELDLQDRLQSGGQTTLGPEDVAAAETLRGLGTVDLAVVESDLARTVAPIERVGLDDLVGVTAVDDGVRYSTGTDRTAATVRERLETVDRDPTLLGSGHAATLLGLDPRTVRYLETLRAPEDTARLLRALVEAPGWFPPHLEGHVADAGALLANVASLLYDPDALDVGALPSIADRLRELASVVSAVDRIEEVPALAAMQDDPDVSIRALLEAFAHDLATGFDLDGGGRTGSVEYAPPDVGARLNAQLSTLEAVLSADGPVRAFREGVFESVRRPLVAASRYGVYGCIPVAPVGGYAADAEPLVAQLVAAQERVTARLEAAGDASASTAVETHRARLRALLGDTFPVLPPFEPPNGAELVRTFDADLLPEDSVAPETWLQRAARVRKRLDGFREARTYGEVLAGSLAPVLRVGQVPHRPGDDRWVGLDDVVPDPGRTSLVVQPGNGFDPGSRFAGPVAGLFVDEWVERIPTDDETTGVALNYDDPGTRAPQSILLAAPPREGGWSRRELGTVVTETQSLARLRMVDLEALSELPAPGGTALGHLLPWLAFPREYGPTPPNPTVDFDALARLGPNPLDWILDNPSFLGAMLDSDGGDSDE